MRVVDAPTASHVVPIGHAAAAAAGHVGITSATDDTGDTAEVHDHATPASRKNAHHPVTLLTAAAHTISWREAFRNFEASRQPFPLSVGGHASYTQAQCILT